MPFVPPLATLTAMGEALDMVVKVVAGIIRVDIFLFVKKRMNVLFQ